MKARHIGFGDNVRVIDTPYTQAKGLAGLVGNVYGETVPSLSMVDVIGEIKDDFAFNVYFEECHEQFWFAIDQIELVDHAPGTEAIIDNIKFIRTNDGEWEEIPNGTKHKDLFERIHQLITRKRKTK